MRWFSSLAVGLALASACTDSAPPQAVTGPLHKDILPVASGASIGDSVETPAGLYSRDCVRQVPSGSRVHQDGSVDLPDGTRLTFRGCTRPVGVRVVTTLGSARVDSPIVPTSHGWLENSYEYAAVGHVFRQIDAKWMVPSDPDSAYSGLQVLFAFPGLDNSGYILQPVLQYGNNNSFGGNYWSLASWYANSSGVWSTPVYVSPGDTITGQVQLTSCGSGYCSEIVRAIDERTHDTTTLAGTDFEDTFNWATGGALETYSLTNCGQFPWGGLHFSQISLYQDDGIITPSWGTTVHDTTTPHCGYGVTTSSTTTTLADSSAPAQIIGAPGIEGPTTVTLGSGGVWDGERGHDGEPPYSWWWTGLLSGTGTTISGSPTSGGYLVLHVVDQVPDTASDSIYVTICNPKSSVCPESVIRRE